MFVLHTLVKIDRIGLAFTRGNSNLKLVDSWVFDRSPTWRFISVINKKLFIFKKFYVILMMEWFKMCRCHLAYRADPNLVL